MSISLVYSLICVLFDESCMRVYRRSILSISFVGFVHPRWAIVKLRAPDWRTTMIGRPILLLYSGGYFSTNQMVLTLRASWFNLIKFITKFVTRNINDKNLWRKDRAPPLWFVCLMMLTYLQESLSCQFKNLRRANDICVLILCLSWIKTLYDTAYHTYTDINPRRRSKKEKLFLVYSIMASWIYHLISWCFDIFVSLPGFKHSGEKNCSH
jgi:hypothetical protein